MGQPATYVIGYDDVCRMLENRSPKLTPSTASLRMYNDSKLKSLGEYHFSCRLRNQTHDLKFQVVDTKQHPLLCADTCQSLGLIELKTVDMEDNVDTVNAILKNHVEERNQYDDIIKEYHDVFEGLGCLPGKYHIGIYPNAQPVQHYPRKVPLALKSELKKKVGELVDKGIVARVSTPTEWISSMVVVKKPNKLRICIDPKDLNKAIQRPHYPLPTIEEILPSLAKAKLFSVLDAKDGFWQVKLDEESSYLTTFWTPFGRYRWLRMPSGIASAPEEYQRRQHEVLEGLQGVEVIADDILVYGCGDTDDEAMADHDQNLRELLKRAREVNLKLNESKIQLRLKEVPYIGHLLTSDGLKPDPEKVRAVIEMPKPSSPLEVQRFLGFINYLAKFMPKLSEVCVPLRNLPQKQAKWTWSTTHDHAFQKIKDLITRQPVLRYFDVNKHVTIQCDASQRGLGATLLQQGQPVAFASRTMTSVEERYAQKEKECLAIVFACDKFEQYIFG